MINVLTQNPDTIPFMLKQQVVPSIDSIPKLDFLSYEYLPLDSSKVFYNIDAIDEYAVFTGLEGLVRPFVQQFGSVLFLVFAALFVLSAIVFKQSGLALFGNVNYIFNLGKSNKNSYGQQVTTSDLWSNLFFILQAFVIYSIFFFDLALEQSHLFFNGYDYLVLFSVIFAVIALFSFSKYMLYKFMGALFSTSKTNALVDVYLWIIYIAGILSFIPIVAYIYIPEVRMYVIFFLLAVFLVGRIAVFAKSYSFFIKYHIGSLYFFVYLCGVEILPYFLLYKAIVSIN